MGDSSLNGMVREEMHHQDDEKRCRQQQEREAHHFKNGMDEQHDAAGEDAGEYESAHRGGQEQDDFGNGFLFEVHFGKSFCQYF